MKRQTLGNTVGKWFFAVGLLSFLATWTVGCGNRQDPVLEESTTMAAFRLGSPFSSHMVVQRDVAVPIWGMDRPGQAVRIESGEFIWIARADEHGRWKTDIGPFAAGGPYEIAIDGSESVVLTDVLAGEVWLASGQSNMEWHLQWTDDAEAEIARADWPRIRLLTIPHNGTVEPVDFVANEGWKPCTPENVAWFSAAAYYFGKELHQELGVPIGLVNCSWGGASMEAWTPLDAMANDPVLAWTVEEHAKYAAAHANPAVIEAYERKLAAWIAETGGKEYYLDPGDTGLAEGMATPDFDDSAWKTVRVPEATQKELDAIDGVFWFRHAFDLPADWAGQELRLTLGAIDDTDVTYLNGVEVGRTGEDTPGFWAAKRDYVLPAGVARAGRNVLAVRVFDRTLAAGFTGAPNELALGPADGSAAPMPLAGTWKYHVTVELPARPAAPTVGEQNVPALLYNGMIHPLEPMRFRGAIWYQGESNAVRADQYRHLSEVMIGEWRQRFGHGDFPFLLVQLAGFDVDWPGWLEVMEAQAQTLELPATAMAVAADIGDPKDIHPRNKRELGHRLALAARATVYGEEDLIYSGPLPTGATTQGNAVLVSFDHVGSGLVSRSGGVWVKGFEIAGEDGHFVPATAMIRGNEVAVSSQDVPSPKLVRYAWRNYPACDLYNAEGLPTPPFRMKRK
ncbi:MAG: sialate O-acetylesterase [Candidatus Sumerlaeota bacterium]|nr:sialate O-acetylesterase [Candidatus Sumerlaeota bacterium]